jgi:hypothetical protein
MVLNEFSSVFGGMWFLSPQLRALQQTDKSWGSLPGPGEPRQGVIRSRLAKQLWLGESPEQWVPNHKDGAETSLEMEPGRQNCGFFFF